MINMARSAGVEPTTPGFGGLYSIQLSYERLSWRNSPLLGNMYEQAAYCNNGCAYQANIAGQLCGIADLSGGFRYTGCRFFHHITERLMMDNTEEDFTRVFMWILAGLVLFTIVIILLARAIGMNENSGPMTEKDIDERTKPYSSVRVSGDPAETQSAQPASPPAIETTVNEVADSSPTATEAVDGRMVYDTACAVCHNAGIAGAPALGSAAWQPRIAAGMETLVANAINGKGAMPPKGGRPDFSDTQIKAAVEYMVNAVTP